MEIAPKQWSGLFLSLYHSFENEIVPFHENNNKHVKMMIISKLVSKQTTNLTTN